MSPAWRNARQVLAVRLDGFGDVLMTTPALRALRESFELDHLVLMSSRAGAGIASMVPEVDDAIVYEAPWMKVRPEGADAGADRAVIDDVRERAFDAAVVFTVATQSALPAALLCFLAEVPLRLAHVRENPYRLLTDVVRDPDRPDLGVHEVERQLALVDHVGARTADRRLSLVVSDVARDTASGLLDGLGIASDEPWAVVHPGATAPSRRYPEDRFAVACTQLARLGVRIVFTGSKEERPAIERIRGAMAAPSASLGGRLGLDALAAVLAAAPVVVTNNTGPAHIAAAVGTPVVDLYALTNPQHTPWMVPSRVLSYDVPCRHCLRSVCPEGHHLCLRGVPAEAVVSATLELLREAGVGPRAAQATA